MDAPFLKYSLTGISTEQFATVYEPAGDDFSLNVSVSVKSCYADRRLGLNLSVRFCEEQNVFMQIETTCHFLIDEDDWIRLSDNMQKNVVLPCAFIHHLLTIAIGSTRGILHAKTENTPYNKYLLPLIDVTEIGSGDAVIERDN